MGTAATLATQASVDDDDCVHDDDHTTTDGIVHRRRLDTVVVVPSSHRSIRAEAANGVESEWPWEEELSELAFSMEHNSMSISSKAGKSSKASVGKSGKSSTVRYWCVGLLLCDDSVVVHLSGGKWNCSIGLISKRKFLSYHHIYLLAVDTEMQQQEQQGQER